MLLQKAPKAKSSPKRGLLFPKAKAEKAHFTLGIEKLLWASFPSFYGRTVIFFFPRLFSSICLRHRLPPSLRLGFHRRRARRVLPRLPPSPCPLSPTTVACHHRRASAAVVAAPAASSLAGGASSPGDAGGARGRRGRAPLGGAAGARVRRGRAPLGARPGLGAGGGELPWGRVLPHLRLILLAPSRCHRILPPLGTRPPSPRRRRPLLAAGGGALPWAARPGLVVGGGELP